MDIARPDPNWLAELETLKSTRAYRELEAVQQEMVANQVLEAAKFRESHARTAYEQGKLDGMRMVAAKLDSVIQAIRTELKTEQGHPSERVGGVYGTASRKHGAL